MPCTRFTESKEIVSKFGGLAAYGEVKGKKLVVIYEKKN